jgi:hypothetical protein
MRTSTAGARHRAHHTIVATLFALLPACGPSIPRPPETAVAVTDYVAVTFPPKPPPVEFIPPSPQSGAVWADGSWEWNGDRYGWVAGRWVILPPGALRARWTLVRRKEDGQLFFAPSTWKTADGQLIDDGTFSRAPFGFGSRGRARSRAGHESRGDLPELETEH